MFRTLLNGQSEGVYVIDAETFKISFINDAAKEIFGLVGDPVGRPCYEVFEGNSKACPTCPHVNNYREERTVTRNKRVLEIRNMYYEEDGRKYYAEFAKDVTLEQNAAVAEEQAQMVLTMALEQSNLIYWEYDLQTHTCYRSDRYVRLIGGAFKVPMIPEELEKDDSIGKKEQRLLRSMYERILNGEDEVEEEMLVRILGREVWCRIHFSTVVDVKGDRVKAVCVMQNLEELKELEESLFAAAKQNQFEFFTYDIITDKLTAYRDEQGRNAYAGKDSNTIKAEEQLNIHPDDLNLVIDSIRGAKEGAVNQEITVRRHDKRYESYRLYRIRLDTFFDNSGNPVKIYGTVKDITEDERDMRQYRVQMAFMETYKRASLAYADLNLETNRVTHVKTKHQNLRKAIDNKSLENWVENMAAHIEGEQYVRLFRKCFFMEKLKMDYVRDRKRTEISVPFWLDENKLIYARFIVNLIDNPVSKDVEGYIIIRDETEQQLRAEVGKSVIGTDYDLVALVDIYDGKIDNIFGYEYLGFHDEKNETFDSYVRELALRTVKDEVNKLYDLSFEYVKTEIEEKGRFSMMLNLDSADGEGILQKNFSMVRLENFPSKLLLGIQDVTNLYQQEKEIQQTLRKALEKAKAGENAKMDFLSRMSHDLRTPLNGIIGLADIATDECNDANILSYLEKINASGKLLVSLVNDILDVAQGEEKKMTLRPEAYSMREFLDTINQVIVEQCKSKSIEYNEEMSGVKDLWFNVDKLRFNQVFLNLLSNAVKYTPEGGKVTFKGEVVKKEDNICHIEFHVIDNGIGMSESFIEHAFDVFSQGANGRNDGTGSGLGLAIVKQIIDLTGCEIFIDSELNKGTDMKVIAPLSLAKPQVVEQSKEVNEEAENMDFGNKVTVLVAEDQPLNAKIIVKMLNKKGIRVDLAEDGRRAVSTFLSSNPGHYAAILMDVRMPIMNGLEATKVIRSHTERSDVDIPIIAATANAFLEDREQCIEAGMTDYITKPINTRELYDKMSIYISGYSL